MHQNHISIVSHLFRKSKLRLPEKSTQLSKRNPLIAIARYPAGRCEFSSFFSSFRILSKTRAKKDEIANCELKAVASAPSVAPLLLPPDEEVGERRHSGGSAR